MCFAADGKVVDVIGEEKPHDLLKNLIWELYESRHVH